MKTRNWITALVVITLIVGSIIWEQMSLIVSIVAIVFYALVVVLFVGPSFENVNENKNEQRES